MTMAINGGVAGTVAVARKSLDNACDALDEAVRAIPDVPGDDVMANPGLVALLLRVVVARRHLSGLELSLRRRAWAASRLRCLSSRSSCGL